MRALTLHQPWAWAITHADKRVENRSRPPPKSLVGLDFAIHAGLRIDDAAVQRFYRGDFGDIAAKVNPDDIVRGAVVAVARLSKVVEHEIPGFEQHGGDCWFFGPVGYLLTDVRVLREPVPCRGLQGFWPLPPEVEATVRAQLAIVRGLTVHMLSGGVSLCGLALRAGDTDVWVSAFEEAPTPEKLAAKNATMCARCVALRPQWAQEGA